MAALWLYFAPTCMHPQQGPLGAFDLPLMKRISPCSALGITWLAGPPVSMAIEHLSQNGQQRSHPDNAARAMYMYVYMFNVQFEVPVPHCCSAAT